MNRAIKVVELFAVASCSAALLWAQAAPVAGASSTADVSAQITDLQNQLKLLQAKQALADSATTLKTDAATRENSLVTAENNLLTSQISGMKQLIPSVQSGVPGAISGDGGTMRGTVEAWGALNSAFQTIAKDIKVKAGDTCSLLLNPTSVDDYSTSKWVGESLGVVADELPNKIKSLESLTPSELLKGKAVPPGAAPSGFFAAPALAGTLIDSIVSFTKLFRTDRNIAGITVTASNETLYNLAASKLSAESCEVVDVDHLVIPGQDYATVLKQSRVFSNLSRVLESLSQLDKEYETVSVNAMNLEADPKTPKTTAATYDAAVARWKDASDKLHQAIDPIAFSPVSSTDAFTLKILRGILLTNFFENDKKKGKIVYTKIEAIGGTRVTSKNTWRSDREYMAASYVVSYRLLSSTGEVLGSGVSSSNGAFEQMHLP